jgi:hypothetical protein
MRVNDIPSLLLGDRARFLWLLLQLSEQAQEALWNRRGGLVFPQLAERTIHPIVGGFPSRTLFQ